MKHVMLDFKEEIINSIRDILGCEIEIPVEIPAEDRGDYAVPCFSFSPVLKKSPKDIAMFLAKEMKLTMGHGEAVGPYVNFWVNGEVLVKRTLKAVSEGDFGRFEPRGERVLIEHTSANPNAPLHVGNARNPIIGDTVSRIFRRLGYDVTTEYYVDDMGRQVAMQTWGIRNLSSSDISEPEREKPDHELMTYYQKVAAMMEDETVKEGVQEVIRLMESGDEEMIKAFKENSQKVLWGHKESLKRLNILHDSYKTESSLIQGGQVREAIDALWDSPLCGEEDGALYIDLDGNKVFLTRGDGTSLYPARDIAYHMDKASRADRLIDVLGEDHKMHGLSICKALESLNVEHLPEMIYYSFVSLEGNKMSTRSGRSVWLDDLMDMAYEGARNEILERRDDLDVDDLEDTAECLGMGAVRFNIIKVQPEKSMDFRWSEALNFQGNSAPFVQYSHARASSIIRKWGGDMDELAVADTSLLNSEGEIRLIKKIARFPCILIDAATSPHLMANYALQLAGEFNQFYRDHPVLQSGEHTLPRLYLVLTFKTVMRDVLDTLGIKAPDRM